MKISPDSSPLLLLPLLPPLPVPQALMRPQLAAMREPQAMSSTCEHTHIRTRRAHTHMHTHTNMHARTHTSTHTGTHNHAHTHIHTHLSHMHTVISREKTPHQKRPELPGGKVMEST